MRTVGLQFPSAGATTQALSFDVDVDLVGFAGTAKFVVSRDPAVTYAAVTGPTSQLVEKTTIMVTSGSPQVAAIPPTRVLASEQIFVAAQAGGAGSVVLFFNEVN